MTIKKFISIFVLSAISASAQITVFDLSEQNGSSLDRGTAIFLDGDSIADFEIAQPTVVGGLNFLNSTQFFGDSDTAGDFFENSGEGFQADTAFPREVDFFTNWYGFAGTNVLLNGYVAGTTNWTAIKDSQDHYGWISFELRPSGDSDLFAPSFGAFVYDPDSTSPATAITLGQAIAATAPVPEPSSAVLALLASVCFVGRRRRAV